MSAMFVNMCYLMQIMIHSHHARKEQSDFELRHGGKREQTMSFPRLGVLIYLVRVVVD
jgi:hypothetical protein